MVPVAVPNSAMPLGDLFIVATLLFPAAMAVVAPFLVRYRGGGPALAWRARGLVPVLLSLLAFAVAALALLVAFGMALTAASWGGRALITAYWVLWALYLQIIRAAAIHRARVRGDARRLRATFG